MKPILQENQHKPASTWCKYSSRGWLSLRKYFLRLSQCKRYPKQPISLLIFFSSHCIYGFKDTQRQREMVCGLLAEKFQVVLSGFGTAMCVNSNLYSTVRVCLLTGKITFADNLSVWTERKKLEPHFSAVNLKAPISKAIKIHLPCASHIVRVWFGFHLKIMHTVLPMGKREFCEQDFLHEKLCLLL